MKPSLNHRGILIFLMACFETLFSGPISYARAQSATANFYTPVPTQGTFLQDLSYGSSASEILDVCRPENGMTPHPGILMIHGGGWTQGDKGGLMDTWCQNFAKLGYVVADIDYRLDDVQNPNPEWPAFQIGDVQLAIRWMRYHATELNLNPTKLCAYGTSAGAYLTVFVGTQQSIFPSDVNWIAPLVSVRLSCLIDGFGPVDLTTESYQPKIIRQLIGVSFQVDPGIYKDDSPVFLINSQTPPTLLIHGTQDSIVPISQSYELAAGLKRVGVSAQLVTYNGGHAYHGLSPAGLATIFDQISRFLAAQ